jgi:predicted amidohydrolase
VSERAVLAAAQFRSVPRRLEENAAVALDLVASAAERGADLVVLPEFCVSGYDREWIQDGAPGGALEMSGPLLTRLAHGADALGISVVFNDLERRQGRLHSSSFILAGGDVVGLHRKTVLTEGEVQAGLTAGATAAVPVSVPGVPVDVAPMVCFEHGFPEIALDLALAGAGVIAICSAIQFGTQYLRNLRTRARAQDNGCYVVAANSVGDNYCGESMIVDPRGDVLVRASATDAEVIMAELDPGLIAEQRRQEPVLQLRRPELRRPSFDPSTH